MTMVEVIVASAVGVVILMAGALVVRQVAKNTARSRAVMRVSVEQRLAVTQIQRDFMEMNELVIAEPQRIRFLQDSHRLPGYNGANDYVVDRDGDAMRIPVSEADARAMGNDLDDDDDDGVPGIDLSVEYRLEGRTLVKDTRVNGGPPRSTTVAQDVLSMTIEYFAPAGTLTGFDASNDGLLNESELRGWTGCGGPLMSCREERNMTRLLKVGLTLAGGDAAQAPETVALEIAPPLLQSKRKFP
jgi:hypothetical protein